MLMNGYLKRLKPSGMDQGQVNINCIRNEEV